MRKSGFSIVELLLSLMIMFLVAASVVPILFKKNKKTLPVRKQSKSVVFSCHKGGDTFIFKPVDDDGKVLYDPERDEFFTVTLIGGGAGAGKAGKAGQPGEVKQIILPSMPGEYKITLGKGGAKGENGYITKLERITKEKNILIEYARGGVVSNVAPEGDEDKTQTPDISNISILDEDTTGKAVCGSSGTMGEVIIEWR